MFNIKKRLRSNRGETLVEAIVSILLLAILMTTVTLMIQTSLRLTANSMQDAERVQNDLFNPAVWNTQEGLTPGQISFNYSPDSSSINADYGIFIDTKHDIQLFEDEFNDIVAFYPDLAQNGG